MDDMPEEKSTLVAELGQVQDMARQLVAHLEGQQQQQGGGGGTAAGGDQICREQVSTIRASIDRAVDMAMSCCADGRAAVGQLESRPSGGDSRTRSAVSDQAGELRCRDNAASQGKKRNQTQPKVSTQVRVSAVQDVTPQDDGFSWRKYGQKDVLGAKYPRGYYRCIHRNRLGCLATKQVQRTDGDPLLFDVVYHGTHTCAQTRGAAAPHNNQGTWSGAATSAEHAKAQPQPAKEHTTASGFQTGPVLPFMLPSDMPTSADDASATNSGSATTSCVTVIPSMTLF